MCACCDCNSSCHGRIAQESPLKAKEPRRSQRNETRSWKQACQFANIMQTFWSTELARTGKEPKDGRNLSCNFYVCKSCPHQYQRLLVHTGHCLTLMGQIKLFPISRNMPCTYMTTCDLDNSVIFCLSCKLYRVLQLHIWVTKSQQYSPTRSSLPASPLLLSMTVFQAGKLSVERPQTALKSLKYVHVISLYGLWHYHACNDCRSWFWIWPKSHRESVEHLSASLAPHLHERRPNECGKCGHCVACNTCRWVRYSWHPEN